MGYSGLPSRMQQFSRHRVAKGQQASVPRNAVRGGGLDAGSGPGWRPGVRCPQEMASILAQLSPVRQQEEVVPAARESMSPVGQQKLAGEFGHLSKPS